MLSQESSSASQDKQTFGTEIASASEDRISAHLAVGSICYINNDFRGALAAYSQALVLAQELTPGDTVTIHKLERDICALSSYIAH